MAQRYIYLQDELNNKLKEEENASALISRLLNEHYKFSKVETMAEIEEAEKQIQDKRNKLNQELAEEENQIITKKEIKVKEIEFEEKKQELTEKQKAEKRESIKQYFKLFTQREITEAQLDEYMQRLEDHEISGLGEYIEELREKGALAPA